MSSLRPVVWVVLVLALASLAQARGGEAAVQARPLTSLETLDALRAHFNDNSGKLRFVTLLSPT